MKSHLSLSWGKNAAHDQGDADGNSGLADQLHADPRPDRSWRAAHRATARTVKGVVLAGEFAERVFVFTEHASGRRAGPASGLVLGASYIGLFLGAASGRLRVAVFHTLSYFAALSCAIAAILRQPHLLEPKVLSEVALPLRYNPT